MVKDELFDGQFIKVTIQAKESMVGYHYTSWEAWTKIQKEGLIPYTQRHDEVNQAIGGPSIWIWPEKQKGLKRLGNILYQMATKGIVEVVLLEVTFNREDKAWGHLNGKEGYVETGHNGTIEKLVYHDNELGLLLTKPIPPSRIRLLKSYNLVEMLERWEEKE